MLQDEQKIRRFLLEAIDRKTRAESRPVRFVQIGANDGVTDDPLSEFILRGNWQGVLIEPVRSALAALKANYAGIDGLTFLNVAVTDHPGKAEMFTCGNSEVSSLSRAFVEKKSGSSPIESYRVRPASLTEIMEHHLPEGVDVLVVGAGSYDAVILSIVDFSLHRPKLILFESHNVSRSDLDAVTGSIEPLGYVFIRMHADTAAFAKEEIPFDAHAAELLEKIVAEDVSKSKRLRELEKSEKNDAPPKPNAIGAREISRDAVQEPRSQADGETGNVRRWYFSTNSRGFEHHFENIQVAVVSAAKNTSLTPVCMYNGFDCWQLEWLVSQNVEIIRGESSLESSLREGYGNKYDIFSAHWLRVDIPEIETDDFVLYTDIDVIFLDDPMKYIFNPNYIAATEEMKRGDRNHFNSGVMVLNNRNLRLLMPWFKFAIRNRLANDFKHPPHDQGSFNEFFKDSLSWLDPRFNWKPYWGVNTSAAIVHFHGPKPKNIRSLEDNIDAPMKASFKNIYRKSVGGYKYYMDIYDDFLTSAQANSARPREERAAETLR